jgi:adenylosuccinate synthase
LPSAARKYLDRLEGLVGVRVAVVSVGPGREQSLANDAAASSSEAGGRLQA